MTRTPPGPSVGSREERRAPNWLDAEAYPFDSHYADVGAGEIHYVDEGTGRPVVMLHGNPTWSFVYRDLIRELSDEFRCVAPDYLGFGLSDRPRGWSYGVRDHAATIRRFLRELDLEDATFVLHDWGGPIGMQYATSYPDTVDSFVVLNSAAWPLTYSLRIRLFSRLAGSRATRALARRKNVPVDWLMARAFGDEEHWTPWLRRHYAEPMREQVSRRAALTFARELLGATDLLEGVWDRRPRVAGKPALLCWGGQDPLFRERELERWQALFPDARTVRYPTAGHFLQEEVSGSLAAQVHRFVTEQHERRGTRRTRQ